MQLEKEFLGGDSDTIACIVGGISEAFYGVPSYLKGEVNNYLPLPLRLLIKEFYLKREFLDFISSDFRYSRKFKEYVKEHIKIHDHVTNKNIGCFDERIDGKLVDFNIGVPKLRNKEAFLINLREFYKAMDLYSELYENIKKDKKEVKKLTKNKKGE